jgi:hypothetical protein
MTFNELHGVISTRLHFCFVRDNSVGIQMDYRMDDRGIRVRLPEGARNCSLLHSVQTGPEVHPAFCPMGIGGFLPGGKAAEA